MKKDKLRAIVLTDNNQAVYLSYSIKKIRTKNIYYYEIPSIVIKDNLSLEENLRNFLNDKLNLDIKIVGYLGQKKTLQGIDYYFHCEVKLNSLNLEDFKTKPIFLKDLTKEEINILPVYLSYIEKALKKDYKTI